MLIAITIVLLLSTLFCIFAMNAKHLETLELKTALRDAQADHQEWLEHLPRVHPEVERELSQARHESERLREQLRNAQIILDSLKKASAEEIEDIQKTITSLHADIEGIRQRAMLGISSNSTEYKNAMQGYTPKRDDPI